MTHVKCLKCSSVKIYETICQDCFTVQDVSERNLAKIYEQAHDSLELIAGLGLDGVLRENEFLKHCSSAVDVSSNVPIILIRTNQRYLVHQCNSDWKIILRMIYQFEVKNLEDERIEENGSKLFLRDNINHLEVYFTDIDSHLDLLLAFAGDEDGQIGQVEEEESSFFFAVRKNKELFSRFISPNKKAS